MSFEQTQEYEERVIITDRVRKTVKGGQVASFRAVVAVGDRKGSVGVGIGKARQTPEAIRKGGEQARRNMIVIPLTDSTIPHEAEARVGGVKVLLRRASRGTGLVAGLGVREVLEVAGVQDILSKSLGAKNRVNRASATFEALKQLRGAQEIAAIRNKPAAPEQTTRSAVAERAEGPIAEPEPAETPSSGEGENAAEPGQARAESD